VRKSTRNKKEPGRFKVAKRDKGKQREVPEEDDLEKKRGGRKRVGRK
jgi:hypothetical protein